MGLTMQFDVIIPARNEEQFIYDIVNVFRAWSEVRSVIVVDNASTDGTRSLAAAAAAEVVEEPRIGKGYAVQRGFRAASADVIFVCDADVTGLSRSPVINAVNAVASGQVYLCRLAMARPAEAARRIS